MGYAEHFENTPQSAPLFGKKMVPNAAGGYVFEVDDWQRLRRFLILGCEGGTYYESERKLTLENAQVIRRCLASDGPRTVASIVEISDRGLAPKNDAAVFALAVATKFGDESTRKLAFEAVAKVCRIATHLFQFAQSREAIGGGWGRGMRRAISRYYDRADLVSQAIKYQERNGWSHRDLLRLAHPKGQQAPVWDAICRPVKWEQIQHPLVEGWLKIQKTTDIATAAKLIETFQLPREMVPTQLLTDPRIWGALLPHMPMTALMRNLGNLSKSGLLAPFSEASKTVVQKLCDQTALQRSRLHPFSVLVAAKIYGNGHGLRGGGVWTPVPQVIEALDQAFEGTFPNVVPTGKRFLLGVDVSGSMSCRMSTSPMSAAEAAAAMALVIARTEPFYFMGGFSTQFVDLGITAHDRLLTVLEKTRDHNFGGTDTSVAIEWAAQHDLEVDVFVILTDNETWAGDRHTCEVLNRYRRKMSLPSKLGVVAFTGTARTIGDTEDLNTMDFVGMDASLPQGLAAFVSL